MQPHALRDLCLSLPQAFESFPFSEGLSVFKTSGNGKVFALTYLDVNPLTVSLKCDPEDSIALRAEFDDIVPGYHLNKKHWVTVTVNSGVPDQLVADLIRGSHDLVRPRVPRARPVG